jgi:protease-4
MFFAAILALFVFCGVIFLIFSSFLSGIMADDVVKVPAKAVLYIDLSKSFSEKKIQNPLLSLTGNIEDEVPTLYELTRMIKKAKTDTLVKGIYLKCTGNANGFAASEELRNALIDFRSKGKFVYAYGDYISEKAYHVANTADKIYCNPKGMFEWTGMAVEYAYFKNLLTKLEIEPQIFYDGKFKSATEPVPRGKNE